MLLCDCRKKRKRYYVKFFLPTSFLSPPLNKLCSFPSPSSLALSLPPSICIDVVRASTDAELLEVKEGCVQLMFPFSSHLEFTNGTPLFYHHPPDMCRYKSKAAVKGRFSVLVSRYGELCVLTNTQ